MPGLDSTLFPPTSAAIFRMRARRFSRLEQKRRTRARPLRSVVLPDPRYRTPGIKSRIDRLLDELEVARVRTVREYLEWLDAPHLRFGRPHPRGGTNREYAFIGWTNVGVLTLGVFLDILRRAGVESGEVRYGSRTL